VPEIPRSQYNPPRGRGGRGGQSYGRAGPSRFPPPEIQDEELESTSNLGNFNFLRSCPKGIITTSSEAHKWLRQCVEKRNLTTGDIFPAAREQNNVFHVLVQEHHLILFDISYEHALVESSRRSNEITAIFHPCNIYPHHDSQALNLPSPEFDLNSIMLHFPQLYFANAKIKYSINNDCFCLHESQNLSTTYITSPICLKKESVVRGSDFQFISTPVIQRWHSVTKNFENVSKDPFMRDYRCLVPQPFPVNTRWSSCHFVPSFHGKVLNKKSTFFLALADPRFRQQASNFYDSEPRHWSKDNHPLLSEPCEGTEFSFHAANLYSCETIPRVSLAVFPTSYDFFLSCSDLKDDLLVEEIPTNNDPCAVEQFLLKERESFLVGKDSISCPVCPPLFSATGRISVLRYSRQSFIVHYRENHMNLLSFVSCEMGTGGGQRAYETCLLYFFSLAHEAINPDSELGLTCFDSDSVVPYSTVSAAFGLNSQISSKGKGKGKGKKSPKKEKGARSPKEGFLDDEAELSPSPDPLERTPSPSEAEVQEEGLPQRVAK